ncbi:MAG TPA: MMPL family transporter [Kineosporiaceae bacterium]|nr:MMPL family transporter [Kineosporiaceae bacterium]
MIEDAPSHPGSRPAYALATVLVGARWLIVVGWVVGAVAALVLLPPLTTRSGGISDITSTDNPAIVAESRAAAAFGFPVLSRTMLVQHDPAGLPQPVVEKAYQAARSLHQGGPQGGIAAALPVLDAAGVVPGSKSTGTTLVTYLYPQSTSFGAATRAAQAYGATHFDRNADRVVGVTGTVPARYEQTLLVDGALPWLEIVSVLAVVVIVGVAFRSVAAPLLTIATAGISYVLVTRLAGVVGDRLGVVIPPDLEPLMVALMVGVTTDYVVYFLSGLRGELLDGHGRVVAARRSVATFAPIVAAAGLTVAAGVGALLAASTPAIRTFAPAMALAVTIALVVALTFVPAVMGILGPRAFWPRIPHAGDDRPISVTVRRGLVRLVRVRPVALLLALICVGGLAWLALPVRHLAVGLPLIQALPADSEPARAADAATAGFAPGIVAPTLVLVQGPDVGTRPDALLALEGLLQREEHVAGVLGPKEDAALSAQAGRPVGLFVAAPRQSAQFVVILDADPLDATAIGAVDRLQDRLPGLLRQAGLGSATASVAGDTAAIAAVVHESERDLAAILLAALLVNLIVLAVVLRALVAPLILLACTVLSVAATLGLTVWLFQGKLGHPGVTFFVPLAAGVLLVALGSDYNLFAVGHIWQEARRRSLREAMLVALPRSSSAITTAGLALAASLGALALVPLRQFTELAFALVVGILLDTYLVRTVLVPALLTVVGPSAGWPGRRLRSTTDDDEVASSESLPPTQTAPAGRT